MYTAVIRTLGTAGEKYQILLDSLNQQTMPPKEIIVYIADGYSIPKETINKEKYVYIKKGMVAQRALKYDEVKSDYILFLDDDLYLPPTFVEVLFTELQKASGDVISPNIFPNAERSFSSKLMMAISGRMIPHSDNKWAYKVLRGGGFSYNNNPSKNVYSSNTNAGACFLCKKSDFLKIKFQEELWVDTNSYPLGEDQIMYYKMFCYGLNILTVFNTGIKHLDAGGNTSIEKEKRLIYSDFKFKIIFWHRFFFIRDNFAIKIWDILCLFYPLTFTLIISLLKGRFDILSVKFKAIKDAFIFLNSEEYNHLPLVIKKKK